MILMVIIALLFFSVLCVIYTKYQVVRGSRISKLPPVYPGALPIIGHAHLLLGDNAYLCDLINTVGKASIENGGVILCNIGTVKYYIVTDPDDFTTAANQCLRKHFAYNFLKPWLGDGLISGLDTATWKRHRKLLNPAFSQRVLNDFLVVFNSQSKQLVKAFSTKVGKGPFDHARYVDQEALENICRTSFGIGTDEGSIFDETKYMKAVQQILSIITTRFQKFWMHSDLIYNFTGLKKTENKVVKYLNDTCDAVLQKKREDLHSERNLKNIDGKKYKAFMDLILELSDEGTLSNKEIWEEMNTIILAGYETVGNSLLYAMILLGSHLDIQDKVFIELHEVFGDSDRDVEKEDLSKLVYLEAVLKETLRVFAVTPIMMRYVDKEVKLKNYTMPAGSNCLLFVCSLHFHPIWGPDVDQFRPERWLDPIAQSDPQSALYTAFAPFGVGRRLCMGKTFAMMSMKTTLAHVLRRYQITADVTKLKLKVDPLLKPVSGHEISLEHRT